MNEEIVAVLMKYRRSLYNQLACLKDWKDSGERIAVVEESISQVDRIIDALDPVRS